MFHLNVKQKLAAPSDKGLFSGLISVQGMMAT
jgi:hypothetical protein